MKRFLLFLLCLLSANVAIAEPWTVGQQSAIYSAAHPLGDGTATGPQNAPAYAYEAPEVPSTGFDKVLWTRNATNPIGATDQGQYGAPGCGTPVNCDEAKARFDCNVTFESHDDPIIAPGVQNGSTHDHTFSGNVAAAAAPYNATYSSLRSAGNSTCYGGPFNRTLYWEPSLKLPKNGIAVTLMPINIVTYYVCGDIATDPAKCSRWPRGITFINGFDMSDPNDDYAKNIIAAANASSPGRYSYIGNGFGGWYCHSPAAGTGPGGATAWAPNPGSQLQPYLVTADGHPTIQCQTSTTDEGGGQGIAVEFQVGTQDCWDGVNLHSPNGRKHMMNAIMDNVLHTPVCPDGWYRVPVFQGHITFVFKDNAEMQTAYFASDRMPGMTQFLNGQTGHFDLIPAWDYGYGDAPGVMLKFFQHCGGLTMKVKNSDGTTFATLTGDPHECGFGRIDGSTSMWVGDASPDGSQPTPVVHCVVIISGQVCPDNWGVKRYFPIKSGTPLPGTMLRPHTANDVHIPGNDNAQLSRAA